MFAAFRAAEREREVSSSRVRGWCFTLNNYTGADVQNLRGVAATYIVFGKEVGESGTPHLQGFVYFANARSLAGLKAHVHPTAHFEPKGRNSTFKDAIMYCKKGEQSKDEWSAMKWSGPNFGKNADVFESGEPPQDQADKGEAGKRKIEERWEAAKEGRFEELPPEQIKTYEYIHRKFSSVEDRASLDNYWIQGPSGCGKSSLIRQLWAHDEFYTKPMNKWWDNYAHEPVAVLDDMDPSHGEWVGYLLKIWTDHYKFNAEVKNGTMLIRPKIVVVTSQYRIDQVFKEPETIAAIQRRFKVVDMFPLTMDTPRPTANLAESFRSIEWMKRTYGPQVPNLVTMLETEDELSDTDTVADDEPVIPPELQNSIGELTGFSDIDEYI